MTAETHRHAGHADIVRELIDGAAGMQDGNGNLPLGDQTWRENHRTQVERAARETDPSQDRGYLARDFGGKYPR